MTRATTVTSAQGHGNTSRRLEVLGRSLDEAAQGVENVVESIFQALNELGAQFVQTRTDNLRAANGFTSNHMCQLQPAIFNVLDTVPTMHSAGFFVAEGILDDQPRSFEWWQRTDTQRRYEPLLLDVEPTSVDCYDYYEMDWFRAARTSGVRHVTSPLIDLPCATILVMTFATPVFDNQDFLGIAGADIAVSRVESHLLRALSAADAPCLLTNTARRVIASNSPTWRAGDRLSKHPNDEPHNWLALQPITPDLGWILAAQDRSV